MNIDPEELWNTALADLVHAFTPGTFGSWIKSMQIQEMKEVGDDHIAMTFSCPSAFHVKMVEERYYALVKEALDRITKKKTNLRFEIKKIRTQPKTKKEKEKLPTPQDQEKMGVPQELFQSSSIRPQSQSPHAQHQTHQDQALLLALHRAGLREDYVFDTFAVSTSNEMAHAAAIAVSQSPGTAYNPLFLYGGVGVGKTHLMQAIGNNILRARAETSIYYTTGEQFTNEIVAAIQQKKTIQLKQKFRAYKVLLVDDVQFLAGKTSVQEEFFHTFNAIMPAGGQIVLTSDRPPHEITLLEDRLKSRFEAGLIVDIQQPTFELRTAIILIKAKKIGLQIPMDLAQRIASEVESTRKLEGILVKLHSETSLFHKELTPELVSGLLGKTEQTDLSQNIVRPAEVIKTVANHFHVSTAALKGPSRVKHLVEARHVAMYILHDQLKVHLDDVGGMFGGRDHTSILHASNKIKELVLTDEAVRTNVNAIKTSLLFSTTV